MLKTKKRYYLKILPEELNYIVEKAKNDDYYFNILCKYFEPLIKKISYRYIKSYKNMEDLIQEGRIGLFYAVKNYDLEKSSNFKIYAIYWIRQSILRSFEKYINTIKIPVRKNKEIRNIKRDVLRKNLENIGKKSNYNEVSRSINTDLLKYDYSYVSIEQDYCYNHYEEKFYDRIKSEAKLPDEIIEENEIKVFLKNLLDKLTDKEREIIYLRFGLENRPRLTLKEIGDIFNYSSEAIRKMEIRILNKLKTKAKIYSHLL